MPKMDGIEVLERLKKQFPEIIVIILTAHGTIGLAVEAMKLGAFDFITKPCQSDHIIIAIQKAFEKMGLLEQNRYLREELDSQYKMVVGESGEMKKIMETIHQVANTKTTILIYGESGTGKQLLSRAIHNMSNRKDRSFVQVNCTTLSEQLLESDLFGHEKGAFTGAIKQKKGRFELADQGTLFLDEIGDLSPAIQARFLHVLEYGEFLRVGGVDTLKADVRVIAATHRDLRKEVKEKRFREDLFFRLNVMTIQLPSLRLRTQDIPLLVDQFIQKHCLIMNKNIKTISPEVLERLKQYPWPGNIRELENAIERAVVLATGEKLKMEHFQLLVEKTSDEEIQVGKPLEETVINFKREFIRKTLDHTQNNQTKAAELLQIQRTYLNRLIKELEI
jgi:DNA-binding NtrC family response regulator